MRAPRGGARSCGGGARGARRGACTSAAEDARAAKRVEVGPEQFERCVRRGDDQIEPDGGARRAHGGDEPARVVVALRDVDGCGGVPRSGRAAVLGDEDMEAAAGE